MITKRIIPCLDVRDGRLVKGVNFEGLRGVSGPAELADVAAALDREFPEDEDSETLGGLVFDQLPVIPEDGPCQVEVDTHGLHIRVESIADRRVDWALVSKLPEKEED